MENAGIAAGDPQPLPGYIEEGQLLPIQYISSGMSPDEMTNILNEVSRQHDSHGYVFGYSCFTEHWDDPSQALVDEYMENVGIAAGDPQPLTGYIEEGQLLPVQYISSGMNPDEMTNILNEVSRHHDSHGYVFGYSCSTEHWDDPSQALVDEYMENAGIAAGDPQPLPGYIEKGQLLPIQYISSGMSPDEMTNILNEVSRQHDSHGYVFGYSCSTEHWDDPSQALVDEYMENAGIAAGDPQPLPGYIEEGQLLPIQYISSGMNPDEMTNILNEVSRHHDSHGYVFGYSCSTEHWDDPSQALVDEYMENAGIAAGDPQPLLGYIEEGQLLPIQYISSRMSPDEMTNILNEMYGHIENMLAGLNSFERLSPRLFTFANEFGSTERAISRLNSSLPEFDPRRLFDQHRGQYQDAQVLGDGISNLQKGYIGCYFAVVVGKMSIHSF
ncbi:hypothetical protein Q3G72_035259 [Acer saccharum]|nr:hypothetical protein Q3G72_035259 [Acer saccharum]